jgi:hypothetical protein
MTTRVIKVAVRNRAELEADPDFVYVGRQARGGWRKSIWHNPYKAPRDGTTAEILARFEHEHLASHPELRAAIPALRGKTLGCWCSPKPCHGDVLARLADASSP